MRLLSLAFVFLLSALPAVAQTPQTVLPGVEVSGGYRFDHDVDAAVNGHGWFFSAAHGLDDVFSLVAEVSGSYGHQDSMVMKTVIPGDPGTPPTPPSPGTLPSFRLVCPGPVMNPACQVVITPGTDPTPGDPGTPPTPDEIIRTRIPGGTVSNHAVLAGPRLSYAYSPKATPFFQPLIGFCNRGLEGQPSESAFCAQASAGANFWTGENVGVYFAGNYRYTSGEMMDRNSFGFGVGLTWRN